MKRVPWLALVALSACVVPVYFVVKAGRHGGWACLWRPKLASGEWRLQLLDRARPKQALLGQGRYLLEISGECYLVRCDFEVPDTVSDEGEWYVDRRTHCEGDQLAFTVSYRDLTGFSVPDALDRIDVSLRKDGKAIYSGAVTRSTTCPEAGLCIFPSPQLLP